MGERRGRLEIMAEILRTAREPTGVSRIVYRSNLNNQMAHDYLDDLRIKGLIEVTANQKWLTTEKGLRLLSHFREIRLITISSGIRHGKDLARL